VAGCTARLGVCRAVVLGDLLRPGACESRRNSSRNRVFRRPRSGSVRLGPAPVRLGPALPYSCGRVWARREPEMPERFPARLTRFCASSGRRGWPESRVRSPSFAYESPARSSSNTARASAMSHPQPPSPLGSGAPATQQDRPEHGGAGDRPRAPPQTVDERTKPAACVGDLDPPDRRYQHAATSALTAAVLGVTAAAAAEAGARSGDGNDGDASPLSTFRFPC
jgi:hypothetical protein